MKLAPAWQIQLLTRKFAKWISLVTSHTFIQIVFVLAGSLFCIAQQKYLLSKIVSLAAL